MKANAPEKIYLTKNLLGELFDGWDALPSNDFISIEYTRTDAFIEKASEWVKNKAEKYIVETSLCSYFDYKRAVENFKNYMKGE